MNSEKMLQAYADIYNATGIAKATLKTVHADNGLNNDRLEWLIIGALEQVEKMEKAAETIDEVMGQRRIARHEKRGHSNAHSRGIIE